MRHVRLGVVAGWALTLLLLSTPGHAQQTSTAKPEIEEQAMAVLKWMAEFLTQAQRFNVMVDTGFDVVQDSGQKIEFGETRQIVLRRPDRVRIEATKRNGFKSGMFFDGKDLAVFNTKENVYATVARPGTVDEAIAYFLNDLDMTCGCRWPNCCRASWPRHYRSTCVPPPTSNPRRLPVFPVIPSPYAGTKPICSCGWRKGVPYVPCVIITDTRTSSRAAKRAM